VETAGVGCGWAAGCVGAQAAKQTRTSFRVGRDGATWAGRDLEGTVSLATEDGNADAHTSGRP
jgi:hypothetical protein